MQVGPAHLGLFRVVVVVPLQQQYADAGVIAVHQLRPFQLIQRPALSPFLDLPRGQIDQDVLFAGDKHEQTLPGLHMLNHVLLVCSEVDATIHVEPELAVANVETCATLPHLLYFKQFQLLSDKADGNQGSGGVETAPCDFLRLFLPLQVVVVLQLSAQVEILGAFAVYEHVRNASVVSDQHHHVTQVAVRAVARSRQTLLVKINLLRYYAGSAHEGFTETEVQQQQLSSQVEGQQIAVPFAQEQRILSIELVGLVWKGDICVEIQGFVFNALGYAVLFELCGDGAEVNMIDIAEDICEETDDVVLVEMGYILQLQPALYYRVVGLYLGIFGEEGLVVLKFACLVAVTQQNQLAIESCQGHEEDGLTVFYGFGRVEFVDLQTAGGGGAVLHAVGHGGSGLCAGGVFPLIEGVHWRWII